MSNAMATLAILGALYLVFIGSYLIAYGVGH